MAAIRQRVKPLALRKFSKIRVVVRSRLGREVRIIVGSSATAQKGWISTEQSYFDLLNLASMQEFLGTCRPNNILMEHVLEHLTTEEISVALQNLRSIMSLQGSVRIAVPDGFHPSPWYQQQTGINGAEPGADDHKSSLNHENLLLLAQRAGFNLKLLEFFDSDGHFNSEYYSEDSGRIERSSKHYRGRLTENQADIDDFYGSMKVEQVEYLKSKGLTYTSLIADLSLAAQHG